MPQAAWCSMCGAYEWVNADGTCANGHPAECLTNTHEVPVPGYPAGPAVVPGAYSAGAPAIDDGARKSLAWLLLVPAVVVVVALVGLVAFGAWSAVSRIESTMPGASQSVVVPPQDSAESTGAVIKNPVLVPPPAPENNPPRKVAKSSAPNLPAPALDAYIRSEYPGYRLLKRVSFPGQYDAGRLGVNYLLQDKNVPAFKLLVSVAQLKKGERSDVDTNYDHGVGDILTNDGVFTASAAKLEPTLTHGGQRDLIDAISQQLTRDGEMIYAAGGIDPTDNSLTFEVEFGPGAIDRAMQDSGSDAPLFGSAVLPARAGSSPVEVDILPN